MAIGANIAYSSSSLVYSIYSRRFSSLWVNLIKVITAFSCFLLTCLIFDYWKPISTYSMIMLLLSGFMGLCLGDLFLYRAFSTLGAGRSLVLYSFQPLMLGLYGYFFLNQFFSLNQTLAVICMIICIFVFMFERNKTTGSWDLSSFMWAFLGISLDAIGLMLSRGAYEATPELNTFQVNLIRCSGALFGYLIMVPKNYLEITKNFLSLKKREVSLILGASITGCFISLTMYMAALKHAHVGTLTSIAITGPVWVSILECIYFKRWPNFYLLFAFCFFITGFYLMIA